MRQGYTSVSNDTDELGRPAGGHVVGQGINIRWQSGPLRALPGPTGEETEEPSAPNGAFVEDVIAAALQRIRHYQEVAGGQFRCRENSLAITKLEEALLWLDARTNRRTQLGIEGTHAEEPRE